MPEPTLHPTQTGDVERPGITLRAYFALELSKAMLIHGVTNIRSPKYFVDTKEKNDGKQD